MKPAISFIVLFYRDEPTVAPVLQAANEVLNEICETFEIIAIDDCSPDGTAAEIRAAARRFPAVVPVLSEHNHGVGGSFRRAVDRAQYPWIGYTDGDDQYDLGDLRDYATHLATHDVITGWRQPRGDGWNRILVSNCFNALSRCVFPLDLRDINSALKLYRAELLRALPAWDSGAFYDTEILLRLQQDHQARIKEVPIRHRPRAHGDATGVSRRNIANVLGNLTSQRMAAYRRRLWWTPAATSMIRGLNQLVRSS